MYAGYTDPAGNAAHGRWGYGSLSSMQTSTEYSEMHGTILYAARVGDGTIKIGVTSHLHLRLVALRCLTQSEPEVLAVKNGTIADEQAIHDSLAKHVAHGREWYRPEAEVLAVINDWRADLNMDPLVA